MRHRGEAAATHGRGIVALRGEQSRQSVPGRELLGVTPGTVAGLLLAAVFAGFVLLAPRRAIVLLVVVGGLQLFQAFVVAGSRIQQGLFPIEVMATVCLALWCLRAPGGAAGSVAPPIDRPFVALLIVAAASFVVSLFWVDPAVPRAHVKPLVSIGQILLMAWPLAIYQFVARTVDEEALAERLVKLVVLLAIPSVAVPVVSPEWRSLIGWSVYFGLAAAPFCFARIFYVRSWLARLGLLVLAVSPAINGLTAGKAFLYGFVAVFVVTIGLLRVPRLMIGAAVLTAGLYLGVVVPFQGSLLPAPAVRLVEMEERQGSWGGPSGRVQLAIDAVTIWRAHPMLGVGPGNSWPYMHHYSVIDTPHNQYLNILLELGVAGLGAFLLLLAGCLHVGWRLYTTAEGFTQVFALGWLGYFVGMTLGSLTGDFVLHSIRNGGLELFTGFYLQWVMLGLLVALSRLHATARARAIEEVAA